MIRYRNHHSQTWKLTAVPTESNQNVSDKPENWKSFKNVFPRMNPNSQGNQVNIEAMLLDHSYTATQNSTGELDHSYTATQNSTGELDHSYTATQNSTGEPVIEPDLPQEEESTSKEVKVTVGSVKGTQTSHDFSASGEVKAKVNYFGDKKESNISSDEKVKVIDGNVKVTHTAHTSNLPASREVSTTSCDVSVKHPGITNDMSDAKVKVMPSDVKDTSQTDGQVDSVMDHTMAGMNNLIVTVTDPRESSMYIKLDDDLANAIAELPMLNGKLSPENKEGSDGVNNDKNTERQDNGTEDRKKDDNEDREKDKDEGIGELEEIELTDLCGDSVLGDIIGEIERRPWECGHCGKMFTYKHNLQTHMLLHNTGPKPLVCPECSRRFRLPHHLRIHRRHVHTGLRPYVCQECGAAFTQSSNLKRHQGTHIKNREKKYRCNVCGKCFLESYHLARHKVGHTSERPFLCKFCSAQFKRKEHLQRHEEIHTKENGNTYPCIHCKRVFSRRQAYERHTTLCEDSIISDSSDDGKDENDDDGDDDNDDNDDS